MEGGGGGRGGEAGNFHNTTVVPILHTGLVGSCFMFSFFGICADEASTLYLFLKKKMNTNIDK